MFWSRRLLTLGLSAVLVLTGMAPTAPSATAISAAPLVPEVVPRLSNWQPAHGSLTLTRRSRLFMDPASARNSTTGATQPGLSTETAGDVARRFAHDLRDVIGLPPTVSRAVHRAGHGDLVLSLTDDAGLGAEGYELEIGDGPVQLRANTSTGLYYGTRTVQQMLRTSADGRTLPTGVTRDIPDQKVRQVMLDAGRKYWEVGYLENLIRQMSWNKLNTLFLQFSDAEGFRLHSRRFPGLADPAVSYDRGDIDRLQAFAAEHHVMLVPGIDMPGHATVISEQFRIGMGDGPRGCAQSHSHSHLGIDWIVDITRDDARADTAALLDEFLPWFTGPYAHLGADELPGQLADCPKVQAHLTADPSVATLGDLLVDFINEMDDVVASHGKRSIIYNGVEHMSSPQQDVHPGVLFMTWEGTGSDPVIPGHDEIAIGPFYLTPNNYHNLYPDETWMYEQWQPSSAPDMLGSGLMNWADYNFWADDRYYEALMAMPRAIIADRTWNASPTPDTVGDFRDRLARIGAPPDFEPPAPIPRTADGQADHHWTFDDSPYPSGWTWAGSPGNTIYAEDTSGELSGTSYIINNPTIVDGVVGEAFHFDHDRDGVGLGGVDVDAPWTMATWVRRTADTGNATLLSSKDTAIKLEQYQTCGQVGFTDKGIADYAFDYSTPLGEWVHLTIVAASDETTLYVNGDSVDSIPTSVPLPLRSVGDVGSSIRGDLDEMQVYDEALGADAVDRLYSGYAMAGSELQAECQTNLALGQPASQSSTAFGGTAARAVDGNTNGSFGSGSVTHTSGDGAANPYWQVDLGSVQPIQEITVWNRGDCCGDRLSDYYVLVSEQPFVGSSLQQVLAQPGVAVHHETGPAQRPTRITMPAVEGRYVRIQLNGNAPLSLAEVQVLQGHH